MTVSEAFRAYEVDVLYSQGKALKTRKNYRCSLNLLLKSCQADLPVELLSYNHIVEWKMYMAQQGHQLSYAASNISRLREVYKYLARHGYKVLDYREIERPQVKPKIPTWLTNQEVQDFLGVIENPRDKAIFALLFSSGARISELLQLDRESIVLNDYGEGEAPIEGKGNKPGVLTFDQNALKILNDYLGTRKDSIRPLFISGQRRRITVSRVEQLCHEYADMAGIDKNVTPHVWRHTFASDLKLNGADIYDISKQLRHSSISTTQIYTHISDQKKANDYRKYHTSTPIN